MALQCTVLSVAAAVVVLVTFSQFHLTTGADSRQQDAFTLKPYRVTLNPGHRVYEYVSDVVHGAREFNNAHSLGAPTFHNKRSHSGNSRGPHRQRPRPWNPTEHNSNNKPPSISTGCVSDSGVGCDGGSSSPNGVTAGPTPIPTPTPMSTAMPTPTPTSQPIPATQWHWTTKTPSTSIPSTTAHPFPTVGRTSSEKAGVDLFSPSSGIQGTPSYSTSTPATISTTNKYPVKDPGQPSEFRLDLPCRQQDTSITENALAKQVTRKQQGGSSSQPSQHLRILNCNRLHIAKNAFLGILRIPGLRLKTLTIANVALLRLDDGAFNLLDPPIRGKSSFEQDLNSLVDVGGEGVELTFENVTFRSGAPFLTGARHRLKSVRIVDSDLTYLAERAFDGVVTELFGIKDTKIRGGIRSGAFSNVRANFLELLGLEVGPVEANAFVENGLTIAQNVEIAGNTFEGSVSAGAMNFGTVQLFSFKENSLLAETLAVNFVRATLTHSGSISYNYFGSYEQRALAGLEAGNTKVQLLVSNNNFKPDSVEDIIDISGDLLTFSGSLTPGVTLTDSHLTLECSCALVLATDRRSGRASVGSADHTYCGATPGVDSVRPSVKVAAVSTRGVASGVKLSAFGRRHHCTTSTSNTKFIVAVSVTAALVAFFLAAGVCVMVFLCCRRARDGGGESRRGGGFDRGTSKSGWLFQRMGRRDKNGTMTSTVAADRRKAGRQTSFDSRRPSAGTPTVIYAIPETRVYQISTDVEHFETAEEMECPIIIQPIINPKIFMDEEQCDDHGHGIDDTNLNLVGTTKSAPSVSTGRHRDGTMARLFPGLVSGDARGPTANSGGARRKSRAESEVFRLPTFARVHQGRTPSSNNKALNNLGKLRRESFGVDVIRRHQTLDI